MPLATLFGKSHSIVLVIFTLFIRKLQEHEMELMRLNQHEENDKKKKGIALKASSSI